MRDLAIKFALSLLNLLSLLPLGIRRGVFRLFGSCANLLPIKERTVARLQAELSLGGPNAPEVIRGMYRHFAENLAESLNIESTLRSVKIRCECEDAFAALLTGKPAIILTAHVGNWELLAAYTLSRGVKLSSVARPARSVSAQRFIEKLRSGYGLDLIWRSDPGFARKIINSFKSNITVAALIDQDTEVESIPIPFFGIAAQTPSTLLRIARRFDANVVTLLSLREPDGSFVVRGKLFDSKLTDSEILTEYNLFLEKCVRQYPEQWVWVHKRWRTRADGTKMRTAEYIAWLKDRVEESKQPLDRSAVDVASRGAISFVALLLLLGLLLACRPFFVAGTWSSGQYEYLQRAEEYSRQGETDQAIAEYIRHIEYRLALPNRPEWENPYFYYLLIGDTYLGKGDIVQALSSYEIAESRKVDRSLISDRFRSVANWYESRGELQLAIDLLTKYRDRDPLLFDAVRDRLAKQLTEREDVLSSQ